MIKENKSFLVQIGLHDLHTIPIYVLTSGAIILQILFYLPQPQVRKYLNFQGYMGGWGKVHCYVLGESTAILKEEVSK